MNLQVAFGNISKFEIEKFALADNHENFYAKTFYLEGESAHQIDFHSIDTHKEEFNLL